MAQPRRFRLWITLTVLGCGTALAMTAHADEGMWLYNNPPTKQLAERYGFTPTPEWLDHLQRSSVRFNSGGSGSFVSSDGLVMTNHHVGADALHKLSTPERDLLADGFHARTPGEELKCVDLELNVLESIEDVTDRVEAAVKPGMTAAEAREARQAVINTIEKESQDATGLRSDVVTLYQGGRYHLYRFKRYTDVRLVFAPEQEIAFFGGDPDNFEYPRYDLDVSFFRVYENGKPAKIDHFLQWGDKGVSDGELVFVSGHPGRTDRLNTVAHLEYLRDVSLPNMLDLIRRREVLLDNYSERGLENERRAKDELFTQQNRRKARLGMLAGLQDPAIMSQKQQSEQQLRAAVMNDSKMKAEYGDAWEQIEQSLVAARELRRDYNLLEGSAAFNTSLFDIARTLVRLADEDQKSNDKRLPEFAESAQESLKQQLFSEAPIYEDLEIVKLSDSLGMYMEEVGADDKLLGQVLSGKSPRGRAAELVTGTKLADVAFRKQLAEGGTSAIAASDDPLIQLARLVDGPSRNVREEFENRVEEPQRQAYAKIAKARFALHGENEYPDATFTLRLAYGTVRGYDEAGTQVPPWTTIGGTYDHAEAHGSVPPFKIPQSWIKAKDKLKLDTPYNFVSTADIIGGNSGSPVVNRDGEVVGLIFDGNIHSLVLDFAYTDDQARAVSVDARAIKEALKSVYGAGDLADQLGK